jgi:cytochrome c551/c552
MISLRYRLFFTLIISPFFIKAQSTAAVYAVDKTTITKGQSIFQLRCATCHSFKQRGIGPSLSGVTTQASHTWLAKFITNSQALVKAGDKRAVAVFNQYKVPMPPNPDLTKEDMHALLSFINTHKTVAGKVDKTAAALGPPKLNPVPAKIRMTNLALRMEEVLTAPPTSDKIPVARINQMTVLKGAKERVFIQDLRGPLYEMNGNSLRVVFDISREQPAFIHNPGLASGFGSYAFHPEFNKNGLFYTTHTEKRSTKPGDFNYHDSIGVFLQYVLTEWKIDDPSAEHFTGKSRELMRVDMPSQIHGVQQITFNDLATKDSADYGLLYIGIGDGGSAESGYSHLCNSIKTIWSTVIRIDPAGNNSRNGQYGIPATNPYASSKDTGIVKEIFARGFRNPNRITWAPDGRMLITDIGLANIEELNIGIAGKDYGWPMREGTFLLNYKGKMDKVYALPPGNSQFVYPVIQYDHDEGNAISGGFVYQGPVESLQGKYIFGDILRGRVFYVEANDLVQGRQATIKEFNLLFNGSPSTFLSVTQAQKADLRFGIGANQELYLYTKTDGKMWKVTAITPLQQSSPLQQSY